MIGATGQTSPNTVPVTTIKQELSNYGIVPNHEGLTIALKDSRRVVRKLAAAELAEQHDVSSAPQIKEALLRESDLSNCLIMAASLLSLGDEVGTTYLEEKCHDSTLAVYVRQEAASRLLAAGNSKCLPDVVDSLNQSMRDNNSPSEVLVGLKYILNIETIPPGFESSINLALSRALGSDNMAVRIVASQCIAKHGDQASAGALNSAVANEKDPSVRKAMREALATGRSRAKN
jgi:HEAT repeat protein